MSETKDPEAEMKDSKAFGPESEDSEDKDEDMGLLEEDSALE